MTMPLRAELQDLHATFHLVGQQDGLLTQSDEMLDYLLCLLRDEQPQRPNASEAEWNLWFNELCTHWVLPLLFLKIRALPPEFHPPERIVHRMRRAFHYNCGVSVRSEAQLRDILAAFANKGIETLVLKGLALGATVYPDPAARPSADIDLLVRPEHYPDAAAVLTGLGYRAMTQRFGILQEFQCEDAFYPDRHPTHRTVVELHWNLHVAMGDQRVPDLHALFQRAIRVETSVLHFHTLHPVDALIFAALHAFLTHPGDIQLKWIYDAGALARRLTVPEDWRTLQTRSVEYEARLALEYLLRFAQAWTGLILPAAFRDFATWPEPAATEQRAIHNAMRRQLERPHTILRLYLSSAPGFFQKIRLLARFLFPGRAYLYQLYSSQQARFLLSLQMRYFKDRMSGAAAHIRGGRRVKQTAAAHRNRP